MKADKHSANKPCYLLLATNSWRHTRSLWGPSSFAKEIKSLADLSSGEIAPENCYRTRKQAERYAERFNRTETKTGGYVTLTVVRASFGSEKEIADRIAKLRERVREADLSEIDRYLAENYLKAAEKTELPMREDLVDDAERILIQGEQKDDKT